MKTTALVELSGPSFFPLNRSLPVLITFYSLQKWHQIEIPMHGPLDLAFSPMISGVVYEDISTLKERDINKESISSFFKGRGMASTKHPKCSFAYLWAESLGETRRGRDAESHKQAQTKRLHQIWHVIGDRAEPSNHIKSMNFFICRQLQLLLSLNTANKQAKKDSFNQAAMIARLWLG